LHVELRSSARENGAAKSTERLARRLVADVARASADQPISLIKLQEVEQRLGIDEASAQAAMRLVAASAA
jgi:hypothetical protein